MSLSTVIYSRLSGFAGLSALVGSRIYPNKLPQDPTFPAVRYQIIDEVPVHSMQTTSGMREARVQVDVFDPDYSDVTAVSDQVELALGRWTDLAADPVVHDVKLMDSARYYEDDIELERKRFDFLFIITV